MDQELTDECGIERQPALAGPGPTAFAPATLAWITIRQPQIRDDSLPPRRSSRFGSAGEERFGRLCQVLKGAADEPSRDPRSYRPAQCVQDPPPTLPAKSLVNNRIRHQRVVDPGANAEFGARRRQIPDKSRGSGGAGRPRPAASAARGAEAGA
jgi:hypothetical protein